MLFYETAITESVSSKVLRWLRIAIHPSEICGKTTLFCGKFSWIRVSFVASSTGSSINLTLLARSCFASLL